MLTTDRLHTEAEWRIVERRWRQVLDAVRLPLWLRQADAAWPWPLRGPVWLWTRLPLVVYTILRWAPFLYLVGVIQAGGFAAADRDLGRVPALIVLGGVRAATFPAHSLLVLWSLLPLGLGLYVAAVYIGYGAFDILWWGELWTAVWGQWPLRLVRWWMGWPLRDDEGPDPYVSWRRNRWVDQQMAREAAQLGLDWRPSRLRPRPPKED